MSAIEAASGALNAFATAQQVTANNVANVSTEGFTPSRVTFEERPDFGGTAIEDIRQTSAGGGTGKPAVIRDMEQAESRPSSTNIITETMNLITNQRAFEANAAVIRTEDEMKGAILNEIV